MEMNMNLQTDKHDRSNVFSVANRFTVHIPITNTQTLPTMTTRCVNWSQANIWVNDVLPGSASQSGHQEVTAQTFTDFLRDIFLTCTCLYQESSTRLNIFIQ